MSQEFNTYFKEKEYDLRDFPTTIAIDTVSLCNLKCSMCVTKDMKRKKGFMDWNLFAKIIDEIAEKNKDATVFMVFSGEPLVRSKFKPDIFEMIKYAKSKGLKNVVMNTNGCLMNKENADKIVESGLDKIFIGIDAFSEEVYNQNRCGGNYHETVNNVLYLIKRAKKTSLKIECQFIEMDNNIHQRQAFIDFWTQKGAYVKIRPMVTWAGKIDREVKTETLKDRKPCSWAMTTMVVAHTGQVVNCACDLGAQIDNGSICDKSIEAIWNTTMKDFRIAHLEHRWNDASELCKGCRDWQSSGEVHYSPKRALLDKIKKLLKIK